MRSSPRTLPGAVLGVVALLLSSGPAVTGEREHVVNRGESASAIARDYYGDLKLGELLLRYNGRTDTTLRVGETLRIPYCELHLVGRGDTWSALAQRYLGGASLHPVLALLNDRTPGEGLGLGQPIAIPVFLSHTLQRGESLGSLAEHYYGVPDRGEILRELNRVEDPRRLPVGQELRIPLLSLWLQDAPPEPRPEARQILPTEEPLATQAFPKQARPEKAEPAQPARAFREPLELAAEALSMGEFAQVRRSLEALAPDVGLRGNDEDRRELARLLAVVYVAFDLPGRACKAFAAAPQAELDPDRISPKVRRALAGCAS